MGFNFKKTHTSVFTNFRNTFGIRNCFRQFVFEKTNRDMGQSKSSLVYKVATLTNSCLTFYDLWIPKTVFKVLFWQSVYVYKSAASAIKAIICQIMIIMGCLICRAVRVNVAETLLVLFLPVIKRHCGNSTCRESVQNTKRSGQRCEYYGATETKTHPVINSRCERQIHQTSFFNI